MLPNGHEADLGLGRSQTQLSPNDHQEGPARSLEFVHQLAGFYLKSNK